MFAQTNLLLTALLGLQAPPPTGSATGTVVDALLRPLPVVRVEASLEREPWKSIAGTSTDGSGRFVLGSLPLRSIWLRFTVDGHTVEYRAARPTERRPAVYGVHRILYPAAPVAVRVVDPAGRPVASAHVVLVSEVAGLTEWEGRFEAVADAAGRAEFAAVGLGPVRAWVYRPGHRLCGPIAVERRGDPIDLPWKGEPGRTLRVELRGVSAELRAAATVRVTSTAAKDYLPRVLTRVTLDADGNGTVADLPFDGLYVRAQGAGATYDTVHLDRGAERARLRGTPFVELALRGRLVDTEGRPLTGQTISVGVPGNDDERAAVVGAGGAFALEKRVPKGKRVGLRVWGHEYALAERGVEYVGRSRDDLDLIGVPTARLSGRVVDARGAPVAGAGVWLTGALRWYIETDANGAFRFERITEAGSPVALEVESLFGVVKTARRWQLHNGETVAGIELQLEPPARVQGVLRGPDKLPRAGVGIVLRAERAQGQDSIWATISDHQGRYVLQAGHAGRYRIDVPSRGLFRLLELEAGQVADLDLTPD